MTRVVLTGDGRAFAAGADAREFDGAPQEPQLPDVIAAIEASPVPWVAAINGVALGGGAEVALGCRARVIAPTAQIGFPEVTLGVIPGAGGTQRLPRLVGLDIAAQMVSLGKPMGSAAAHACGLVDLVAKDPVAAALAMSSDDLERAIPLNQRPAPAAAADVLKAARARVQAKMRGQIAPERGLDALEAGLAVPFAEGMKTERATFLELKAGPQSAALRHMFFAERAAKPAPRMAGLAQLPRCVAVVGGGTMGAGIAYGVLRAGLDVVLIETSEEAVARARANVAKIIEASLARGLLDETRAAACRDRLLLTTDYAQASGAGLAIEAAFEAMEVKKEIFAKLAVSMPPDAVLATNTSYLDVNEIAQTVPQPDRVLGLHFFAPAHIMKLLEIVRADATSEATLAMGFALAKLLRKVPVVSGVCDGFIGNRILARYREAADHLLIRGAMPWDVDAAMQAFGYAMGPYEAQDLSGLDIAFANRRRQDATRDPLRPYVAIADKVVEAGHLGKKVGRGWYEYDANGARSPSPDVQAIVTAEAQKMGLARAPMDHARIADQLVLAMINEAAFILGEGIAQTAADIDLVTVFGYGFPRWRGGLMHHADQIGAEAILARLKTLAQSDSRAWEIAPLLIQVASSGTDFAGFSPD